MSTVLLFGGRSFLGGHICRALVSRGYRVLLHSRASADFPNLADLIQGASIEPVACCLDDSGTLLSLMGRSQYMVFAAIPYSMQSVGQSGRLRRERAQFEAMLRLVAAAEIRMSVFVSVSGTIGRVAGGLADETRQVESDAPKGWGHLALKLETENAILAHARRGLRAVIVNPAMCVGTFDTKPSTGEFFKFIDAFPFALMPDALLNIVDVEDVAAGTVLALEKGVAGERYILSGTNTTLGALIRRIKDLGGRSTPRVAIPRSVAVVTAYFFELLNLILRRPKPLVPLLGIELIEQGSQHLSCEKAKRDLGYQPRDAWDAVDRAYRWYVEHGML